ncbi:E3 ubiquitin-protein ligase SPL2 [Vitis vinifera]|uniref:RING-type E3 ubiquitin transferase n=1 Tax=Vitis vinifera TaxID=29760 RepID=A0A438EWV8_VITVI|nr:E3 ubiquitin-protein ligase SPL2 [Vitis vinifera]
MSAHDQAAAAILAQVALAADGAILGLALAYVAVRSFIRLSSTSSALRQIDQSPSFRVSDLRSLLSPSSDDESDQSTSSDGLLVVVRGTVEAKSAIDGNWKSLRPNVLVSHESGEKGVILQRTQTVCLKFSYLYFRLVPFILVEGGRWPQSDYVIVNMDGSRHPLPLTTVYHQLQPVNASPYTFLQALFGHDYPVGLLDEEKLLPLGKEITAVGICSLKNGIPEIKSCKDLPYFLALETWIKQLVAGMGIGILLSCFLWCHSMWNNCLFVCFCRSEMSKDQMVVDLAFKSKVLFWSGVILGSVSIGVLGYAVVRNWNRWKEWRQQRGVRPPSQAVTDDTDTQIAEDDAGDVPDGELCVICLMRRKRSAFVPCGHLVCCQRCALSVERELSPKCPVCRQIIRSSVRIYGS